MFRFGSPTEPDTLMYINSSLQQSLVAEVWGKLPCNFASCDMSLSCIFTYIHTGVQGVTQYVMRYEEVKELKVKFNSGLYYSVGGAKILLSRRPSHFVLNVFIPTGTLVLVSLIR